MSCTVTRIDQLDNNTASSQVNPAHAIYNSTAAKVYFVYANFDTATTRTENYSVWFRQYDPVLNTFSAAVSIDAPGNTYRADRPTLIRLDSGTLIVAYSFYDPTIPGYCTAAKESTDNGATWSARVLVDTAATASRQFVDMGSDGTNVCLFTFDQGTFAGSPPGKSLFYFKRTGIGTWNAPVTVRDGHVAGAAGEVQFQTNGAKRYVYVKDANTQMILLHRYTSGTTMQMSCFRTVDGGANWSEITVKNLGTDINFHYPHVLMGTDLRLRAVWLETNGTFQQPVIAYSDDYGLTWTVVGTPTPLQIADTTAWKSQNTGVVLGPTNGLYLSTWQQILSIWTFILYKGGDSLAGWTEVVRCDVGATVISNLLGDTLAVGNDFYHIVDPILTGPTRYTIGFLKEAAVVTGGGTGPGIAVESPSGSDQPNIYLTLDIADQRGFSGHDVQVVSFFEWPEGDYTTERRKPEVMALVSSMDMNIQDPAITPAIWKIDDQERWGKEALVSDGTSYTYIDDPFLFRWRSAELGFGESGSVNVFRGVYLRYRRQGNVPFDVQVWVDQEIADVQSVPASWPEPAEFWWPLPRVQNTGTNVQLRIEDREPADLIVEEFAIKFRPKHWRMRG